MISRESYRNREISKNSSSNRNLEKSKASFSNSRSDFLSKNKFKTSRRKDTKRKSFMVRHQTRFNPKKQSKLHEINEEEKGENSIIIENDFSKKPRLTMSEIDKIIYIRFKSKYNKYYTETKTAPGDWGKVRPNLYGYYQIRNLLGNKRCKIKVYFDEFNCYFNDKEKLVEFLNYKQSNNLLKFILTFLKGNNVYNLDDYFSQKYKYKIDNFKEFINIIFEKMNQNISYKNTILNKIIEEIKKMKEEKPNNDNKINDDEISLDIFDYVKKNNIFENDNVTEIKNNLEEYYLYLPIFKKIPLIFYYSIFPNYFTLGYKINLLLRNYIIKELNGIKIKTSEKVKTPQKKETKEDPNEEKTKYIRDKLVSYSRLFNESMIKSKGKSFANKDNLEEIQDYDKPIWSFFKKNKRRDENRRPLYDHEIIDIQNFVKNIKIQKEIKKKTVVSFKDGNKEKKEKEAFLKKLDNNRNKNRKANISSKIKNARSQNKILGILKQRQNDNDDNSTKYILNYDYEETKKDEKKLFKNNISQTNFKRNNNTNDTTNSTKLITQYSTKYIYPNSKTKLQSPSETKNSTSGRKINESHNTKKGTTIKKFKSILYNNNTLISILNNKSNIFLTKSNSVRLINNNKKKYNFKPSKEFMLQSLKKYKKYNLNKIYLKNIEISGLDQQMKKFFKNMKNIFYFQPLKKEEIEENVWKKGIYKERSIILDYKHNKLMAKIKQQIDLEKKRNMYTNIFNNNFNLTEITKIGDIYSL